MSRWCFYTTGLFAFYINATSTPDTKTGIQPQPATFTGSGRRA